MANLGLFILPTTPPAPPHALVVEHDKEPVVKHVVTWSADNGTWIWKNGIPVAEQLADALTAHARDLGVDI